MMSPYRILSLDGGGIRGILTATLLERLEQARPGFMEKVDLFAGTSTGGILALGFAAGMTPSQARNLYLTCGEKVFSETLIDEIRDLGSLIGADYEIGPLKSVLEKQFGWMTLGDLQKKVLVATFQLDNGATDPASRAWKAKFFHNYPGADSDAEQRVVDVAVRTSAAPTYFPIYQGYVDGGVVATNPGMCALAQALHPEGGMQKLEDIVLLSLGTGRNPNYLALKDADWGLVQWAPHLVSLMLEGSAGLADYQCKQVLGSCYLREDVLLPVPIGMDRVDKVPLLIEIALQQNLDPVLRWLEQYF
jgi:uncharacterized protein